jgi:hypothetical protein
MSDHEEHVTRHTKSRPEGYAMPWWRLTSHAAGFSDDLLPPVKALVQVELPDGSRYDTRVVMRRSAQDYLDALRDAHGSTVTGWALSGRRLTLLWGRDGAVWRYPIQVHEVLEPFPALAVVYLGPPSRNNRRREPRALVRVRMTILSEPPSTPIDTITRDVSYSAVRFFTPRLMAAGDHVAAAFFLDDGPLTAPLRVLRVTRHITSYRHQAGHDAVALFDPPLTAGERARWLALCRARQAW